MPNLKEVRIRIASVKSTQQITSAMKMVAASKLRKAQNAILKMRPYAAKLKDLLQNLSASLDSGDGNTWAQQRKAEKVLLVIITVDYAAPLTQIFCALQYNVSKLSMLRSTKPET